MLTVVSYSTAITFTRKSIKRRFEIYHTHAIIQIVQYTTIEKVDYS